MPKIEVVLPIKMNVSYMVEVKDINPEAIRQALLEKDSSDWTVDPRFYEFLGSAYRDVIRKMTNGEVMATIVTETAKVKGE